MKYLYDVGQEVPIIRLTVTDQLGQRDVAFPVLGAHTIDRIDIVTVECLCWHSLGDAPRDMMYYFGRKGDNRTFCQFVESQQLIDDREYPTIKTSTLSEYLNLNHFIQHLLDDALVRWCILQRDPSNETICECVEAHRKTYQQVVSEYEKLTGTKFQFIKAL